MLRALRLHIASVLLPALLLLVLTSTGVWAQTPTVTITRPPSNASNLGGTVRADMLLSPAPAGYTWVEVWLDVFDAGNILRERGRATVINGTNCYYRCISSLHLDAAYTLKAWGRLRFDATGIITDYFSPTVPVSFLNPIDGRHMAHDRILRLRLRDQVPTASFTSPGSGNQSWVVPIASWDFKGVTTPFYFTYNSESFVDPDSPPIPDFSGLSETSSKWSHSFAQFVTLVQPPSGGNEYVVWHRDGQGLAFRIVSGGFLNPDSFHSMEAEKIEQTDPVAAHEKTQYPCRGNYFNRNLRYRWFKITDGDGTVYEFNTPSAPETVFWINNAECQPIQHWMLSRIRDRWGRTTVIHWELLDVRGRLEPRVKAVTDDQYSTLNNPRLNFANFSGSGLIDHIIDWRGRKHELTPIAVPNEGGQNYWKLWKVEVRGVGATTSTQPLSTWEFTYSDPARNNEAYGGTYTGDLVIAKQEPDFGTTGRITYYDYEPVNLVGSAETRPWERDWDGRIKRIWWVDSDSSTGIREIVRAPGSPATLTRKPGDVAVQYTYTAGGDDLTKIRHVPTNRTWEFAYDLYHNLWKVWSPVEPSTGTALVEYVHTPDSTGHILKTNVNFLEDATTPVASVEVQYNRFNLPELVTATAEGTDRTKDLKTDFVYDNGVPLTASSQANLTAVIEAVANAALTQTTAFDYTDVMGEGNDGQFGLPKAVTDAVGATSTFDYQDEFGGVVAARSPMNQALATIDPGNYMNHGDYPASVTVLSYNSDGLPAVIKDPMYVEGQPGHVVSVSYAAEAVNSPNLVVTLTMPPYAYTKQFTLDPAGQILMAKDENSILTRFTYTPSGQVKKIERAYGLPEVRTTVFKYNDQEELQYFDPPMGTRAACSSSISGTIAWASKRTRRCTRDR
jgi:YD repeat-containing protein